MNGVPLAVAGITVRFGGNTALSEVAMRAEPGTVTGLIGPNGAGKTTLFNVISGLQRPDHGTVHLGDVDVTASPPHRRARLGLARTFQRLELFSLLSVRANVRVAAHLAHRHRGGADPDRVTDAALDRVGLMGRRNDRVDELPTGQARLVELARAMAAQPSVLLLDEPASGQDDQETKAFARLLTEFARDGLTVLLVEHDVHLVMSVCSQVYVLDFGQMLAEGTPEVVRANESVQHAYLGAVPS